MKYFIYDACGNIFGNIHGYNRYQDAQRIATRYRYNLWAIYDEKYKGCTDVNNRLVWEIQLSSGV